MTAAGKDERDRMVRHQLEARGVIDRAVLEAMREVPREAFLPEELHGQAYQDSPLPIGEGQTISQPYVVAWMTAALEIEEGERALEVGTGSGYAAAILSRVASEVHTIERHPPLAEEARTALDELGYDNVHVHVGDGTRGWEDAAPYDAIVVAAGGPPDPPPSLVDQLAEGGRLVMPVGPSPTSQELVRFRKKGGELRREGLGLVRFVPLIGEEGWADSGASAPGGPRGSDAGGPSGGESGRPSRQAEPENASRREAGAPGDESSGSPTGSAAGPAGSAASTTAVEGPARSAPRPATLAERIGEACEPVEGPTGDELEGLLGRIGDARVVLLGEATHGTSEFYRTRTAITRALVERAGFDFVAVEADWPDAAQVDHFVRHGEPPPDRAPVFTRFPRWMWANEEVGELLDWLRRHNERIDDPDRRVGFFGLDLYSLHASIEAVLEYLDERDPEAAEEARALYGCLSPWEADPAVYGRAVLTGRHRDCEEEVARILRDLLEERVRGAPDGLRFLDAVQNARLVRSAERYYRVMYLGSRESWNLRDRHMFSTLQSLLRHHGPGARGVVWAHNSHMGDASATEMGWDGQLNVGQLAREEWGPDAYIVGFGTHDGQVAAADDWGGPVRFKEVRPSHPRSYERLCHDSGVDRFLLPLRDDRGGGVREELSEARLERAIGVIYRPETELASHYFRARLPEQFDEYVWMDRTGPVTPLDREPGEEREAETFPFGL